MSTLLYIPVSPRGDASMSRRAGDRLVGALRAAIPGLGLVVRDLALAPPPHPDRDWVRANLMADAERGPAERALRAMSETLIGELEAAAAVVIATPINNFTVPSALKAWIDLVIRPRRTFGFSPNGKVGFLADRPVMALVACGGVYGDTPDAQQDFLSPYLTYALGSIGLKSVAVHRLEGLARGAASVGQAEAAAGDWIAAHVRENARALAAAAGRPVERGTAG